MGLELSVCSSSKKGEDPESSPAAYIDYQERNERLYQERLQGLHKGKIDIGRDALESLWYDVEDFLFPIEEGEEELKVENMNAEQLRQYYHE